MEPIDTLNSGLDDERRELSEYCLGLPTILRKVLEQFSNTELLRLSLVNKQWNFEARSVLKHRGTLSARIWPGDPIRSGDFVVARVGDPCECLRGLALDLGRMPVVPFSGMSIFIRHSRDTCDLTSNGPLNSFCKEILDRFNWRRLEVKFPSGWDKWKNCSALVLVQKILEDRGGELEELSVDCEATEFYQKILQNRSFPSLKTLRVKTDPRFADAFLRLLVSCAPSLKKIHFTEMYPASYFQENFLGRSSAVLVPDFVFCPLDDDQVCEGLVGSLRVEKIDIRDYEEDFPLELLHRYIPMVLEASRTSLRTLRMDLLFAVPLMCYGICLENVTKMEIHMNTLSMEGIEPPILALAKNLNFTRVFPKLGQISIWDDNLLIPLPADAIGEFVEQGNELVRETLPDRAINIKHLKFNFSRSPWNFTFEVLAQMFSNVKTFSAVNLEGPSPEEPFPFALIWQHFASLEELNVDYNHEGPTLENLDSVFCGIFPEEVAELRTKDDDYLKAVNIVPVMPSITCMKDLRCFTLRLTLYSSINGSWILEYDPTFLFSKVTGLIGFAKCPDLSVTLQATAPHGEALRHLRPYVSSYNVVARNT